MSCEIQTNASIDGLDEMQSFFGLGSISGKSWINGILITVHSDTLCFGYGSKLVVANSKYDKDLQSKVYGSTLKKLQLPDENEIVSSIVNITITGGTLDWTCIVVGLSTGGVKFLSENGSILYEKQLHNESILNIKILGEELTIFYPSCVVVLQTTHLIPLLKSLKEMYSKAKTTKIDLMDRDYMLTYKKWDYGSNEINVSDALMIPQQKTCMFDHLVSESLELGFTKKYRISSTQSASVVSTGSKPFISFHSAREGFRQNVFTDVAKAVLTSGINKITSRLPSWLTGSQQQSVEIANEAETLSETLYPRHELIDYQRIGCNIYVAPPHYNLAAITDNLSRITLIDTVRGVMIRMWKGYREAQCGFIEVTEARNRKDQSAGTSNRRSGLFLIIYAPRKSILEIWCLQKGPKVATFQASSHGLLIYNNHSEMPHKSKSSRASCLFFDADDCSLKSFSIPFHCILSEANSRSAEDFHFLKRLKMMLKNVDLKDPSGVNGIIELCSKFQTPEIKLKCLELLTSYRKSEPDIIQAVIEVFLAAPEALEEGAVENDDSIQDGIYRNQLKASCLNHQSLVNCFLMTKEAVEENAEGDLKNTSIELLDNEYLTVQRIVELMNLSTSKDLNSTAKNVSFKDSDNTVVSFLTSFIVNNDHIAINTEKHLNAFDHIGSVLFSPAWKEEIPAEKLRDIFMTSRIASEDTMKCFLYFWLQQEINFSDEDHVLAEMTKFKNILDQVCASAGDKVTYAYNSICLFWQDVREYLLESNYPINSLLAAIICKNFALKKQDESQDFGFEQVTQEECQWTLLTEKLNDVAVLSIFVSQFGSDRQSSSKVKYEVPSISLKKILNDGRGVISELVASWLIGVHLPIDLIFKSSTDETLDDEERNFTKKLEILRQHFPYSLNAAVILCYVIWDLLCRWSKDLSELQYLKNGIQNLNLFSEKDYHLKHGLCVLLWNANFKIPLKATQRLVNKTGRLPKEKLCLQNTMIPDFLIPQFLEQTLLFLDHFRNSMKYNELEFKCEEILTQGSSAPSQSLCELLLQQKRANLPLLNLHYEMIMALELIAFLNIKYTKPMNSLFDDVANEAFFSDINKPLAYTLQKPDEIRVNTRVYFLKKAISTTFDLIVDCHQGVFFDDHFKWIEKIKRIGNVWELDIGLLDRHHILELYVNAFDEVAEELLEKAPARESIVKHLLDIAAKRLTLYLDGNKSGWVHVSSGGSLLINYLETIHSRKDDVLLENLKQSSMAKLYNLTYKIFQIASAKNFSDSRTLRLAGQMLDVTLLLKDGE